MKGCASWSARSSPREPCWNPVRRNFRPRAYEVSRAVPPNGASGRAHPQCLPLHRKPPCPRCHRHGLTLPKPLLLEASTLPSHLDVFRLEDFSTVVVCTERFVDACQRLGLDGVTFQPLPTV
ncbi:MAG TPA: double-CXXCG motif protein [Archangium sp.]|uniref:double-CXXCG motif protein n=1 Tax=Archangium sp. TaxID=1872627 RepID=UPI002ED9D5B6